ncbi:serine hydrolase-like protein isoform X1 [Pieris napi]|uniref:serine hydrolase-like protein isoform X1 n=1 Tax=Pieris napi TaxID=78633 RepID=UPI001FBBD30D|nr:serine hydrolase-like protein isoform X1 [Pieris napi]
MELKEWNLKVPWGNIALLSRGNTSGEPVLLVHGRLDSAATFLPLLKLIPAKYYCVLVDLPGNGKSDPFPKGMVLSRFIGVPIIDLVVQHLGWEKFTYIGHSLGSEQGMFYASIYPKRVKKAVYLDPGPSLEYCNAVNYKRFFKSYQNFYDNYHKYDSEREYTKEQAMRSVLNARAINEEEAEIVLSRCLVETGPNLYRLSWDRRYKITPGFNSLPQQFYIDLFSQHRTPSLFICASVMTDLYYQQSNLSVKLMSHMSEENKNVNVIWVEGGHDVHLTNPERFINELLMFLDNDFVISKL